MEKKKRKKIHFHITLSFTLILSILFSSLPTLSLNAKTTPFIGLSDIQVEENTSFDLLQNISAHSSDGEELQVTVSNVVCETDDTYVYDGSNVIDIGKAGSIYHVEYLAISLIDETESYTASRTITSTASEDNIKENNENTQTLEKATTESNNIDQILNEGQPFTFADMDSIGYSIDMENSEIDIANFTLECVNKKSEELSCQDLQFGNVETIKVGKLKDNVPLIVKNGEDKSHSYIKAHVGNVQVYYIGKLHIVDGPNTADYIYYTTDTQINNKTVYAVLKKDEKITLSYSHNMDYEVHYQFKDNLGNVTENGPDNWSYNDVFGSERIFSIAEGQNISVSVGIPRGYKATVIATDANGNQLYNEKLGEMMEYQHKGNDINQIILTDNSAESMKLFSHFSLKKVNNDITISVQYEKVETLTFNAYLWTQTVYAKDRMNIHGNQKPSIQNSILKSTDNQFVWEFDGITSGNKMDGYYTWELDQLEINGEPLIIPMISLSEKDKSISNTTTLTTGTKVTITVTSKGGTNAKDGKRHYKLEITDCFEDVTISGGNMVSHSHKEYAVHTLYGVENAQYYSYSYDAQKKTWLDMQQDTLIGKKHEANKYTDPLRFKRRAGFYVPTIAFTTKEGRPLQENGTIKDGSNNEPYIEYLIKTSADNVEPEEFRTVPFSEWSASDDGYFYLRGTNKLGVFMNEKEANGVILINIHAQPIKIGLDYQGGGDLTGTDAPKPEDILNIPAKQLGGKNGYNVADNKSLLISNSIPVDKKNEFLFDHWEIIETTTDDTHPYGQLTDVVIKDENNIPLKTHPGSKYSLESDTLKNLANAFYLDGVPRQENTRAVLTLRAVWKKESNIPTIPYMIRYVLADVKDGQIDITSEQIIEERAHTVNKGAMLVTDLYQDGTKTLSANIQNILEGENQNGKDYTEEGLYEWVVYEPQTTRKIESVSVDNNVATIYLIKGNTSIDVNKVWDDPHYQESEVNVQLQRRSDDNASWETTANKMVALNQSNNWNYTFNVPAYYDINSLKQYQYRVVELDSDNNVIENANQITLNDHTYQVQYTQKPETNTWEIKNTRLLDLTISKVVDGKFGDRTKNFTFDISTTNSDGTPLNGIYKYEGSIKNNYEQQATNPGNGTINFTDGKGQFSLSHGQQLTIKNLPVNCLITITEQSENDYSTKYLVNGKDQPVVNFPLTQNTVVDVTNTRANAPDTGLNNKHTGTGFMIALGIIGISFLVYLVIRKRKGSM